MADVINSKVFNSDKKFVDLTSLDYFWGKAKGYIDGIDTEMSNKISTLETAVGDENSGLVKEVAALRSDFNNYNNTEGIEGIVDSKIAALNLPNTYETKGAAEAVASELTTHKNDTTVHVTADERTAWNNAKTAIDAFLKDADMTEKAVDTLVEIQTYMTNDGAAATELVNRVGALEALDHEAYITADTTLETSLKSYVDGKVDNKFDIAGAAATAKAEAIADAEAKLKAVTDTLKTAAYTDVTTLEATMDSKDAVVLNAAKTYAASYTDALFDSFTFASNDDIDEIFTI